jgi:hypothetical protein
VDNEHDSSESEGGNEEGGEGNELEREVDSVDCLNQGFHKNLPFLAQVTISQSSSPSLPTIPESLNALTQPMQPHLSHEEGGEPQGEPCREPPSHMETPSHSHTITHGYNFHHQTHTPPLSPLSPSESVAEQVTALDRIKELEQKVEKLKEYCVLSGGIIIHLQKQVNHKERKKKSSA